MNLALIIIIVIAVILAIFGGLNSALSWLLWVALIVGVIALIVFLFRVISGNRSSVEDSRRPAEAVARLPPGARMPRPYLVAASVCSGRACTQLTWRAAANRRRTRERTRLAAASW